MIIGELNNSDSSPASAEIARAKIDVREAFALQMRLAAEVPTLDIEAIDIETIDLSEPPALIAQRNSRPVAGPDLPTDAHGRVEGGPMAAIRYGLEQARGFMIGDGHGDTFITRFLADNMAEFRAAGVGVFFIDMIQSADQEILDRFMESGDRSELTEYLEDGWNKGPGWIGSLVDLIDAARRQGIEVVGIDIPFSGSDRLETSNPHWTSVISNHMSERGSNTKYLVFGGGANVGDYPFNTGVDARLGIMSGSFQTNYGALNPDNRVLPGEARVNPNPNASTFIFGRPTP
jgi:hypothetical protein